MPACSGRRWPYASETNPDFETVSVYSAGRQLGDLERAAVVGQHAAAAGQFGGRYADTRALLTGRPVSAASTRPVIDAGGLRVGFSCCAGVSRAGCCGAGR